MTDKQTIALRAAAVAIVSAFGFYSYHTISPDLIGVDGYFHTAFSRWIADHGLVYTFKWLPFTIYADGFVDDHLLFHVLLAPFTGLGTIPGGQTYAIVVASTVFVIFYLILANHGIRWAGPWTFALGLSCYTFLFRLCLVRPPSLSLLILLLGCWLLLDGRDRWLAPLGFVYALSYGGFPLLIVMAAASGVAHQLLGFSKWKALGWAVAGCAAGLILNPYFPDNLNFLWKSYTQIELGTFPDGLVAGNEDYPYAASTAVRKAWIVWTLTFAAILAYMVRPIQLTQAGLFLFLFSIALLCLYLLVRRFIEYWPPFAFLFGAFAFQHWWAAAPARWREHLHTGLWIVIPVILVLGGYQTAANLSQTRAPSRPPAAYQSASEFLARTVARDEVIFHSSWGDFPLLYHFNVKNRYISGLGLHYMYLKDPDAYEAYVEICAGKSDRPAAEIVDRFGSEYAFSRKDQSRFIAALERDSGAKTVYEDAHAVVFKLTPIR